MKRSLYLIDFFYTILHKLIFGKFFLSILIFFHFFSPITLVADSKPTLSRVYGDYFISAVPQSRSLGVSGSFDRTVSNGGIISLQENFPGYSCQAIQGLADGSIVVGLSAQNSHSMLTKYCMNADDKPINFGASGIVDLGAGTENMKAMMLDEQARIIVAGGDTIGWISRVTADGSSVSLFTGPVTWQSIHGISQQSSGKIVAVGSNGSYAQIARYTQGSFASAGAIDTIFGSNGLIIFNGQHNLPTIQSALQTVLVDSKDEIYVTCAYPNRQISILKFTMTGDLDSSFGNSGIVVLDNLDGVNAVDSVRLSFDADGNIVVAVQIQDAIAVVSIKTLDGSLNQDRTWTTDNFIDEPFKFKDVMISSDNRIIFLCDNLVTGSSQIVRYFIDGSVDCNRIERYDFMFENNQGISNLTAATLVFDGRLCVAGYQFFDQVRYPYIACFYNQLYISENRNYPISKQQGMINKLFGSTQNNDGILHPSIGHYGSLLQQKIRSLVQLQSGSFLVGIDGLQDATNNSAMMFMRCLSDGTDDTNFAGGSAALVVPSYQTNESIISVMCDASENIYLIGSGSAGTIFRKYTSSGAEVWIGDRSCVENQLTDLQLQGSSRIILYGLQTESVGQISGYSIATGKIDSTFHAQGNFPGTITSTDFNLNFGSVRGVISQQETIFIAYQNSKTQCIDVAAILPDGSNLKTSFGNQGVVQNLFSSTSILSDSVHIACDDQHNLVIIGSDGKSLYFARIKQLNGTLDHSFNTTGYVTISNVGSLVSIKKICCLTDGSILLFADDQTIDDSMLIVRITSSGLLDATFNSQAMIPGIVVLKIGDKSSNYFLREIVDSFIQPSTGNLIIACNEQIGATGVTSSILQIFGKSGTTEVATCPVGNLLPDSPDNLPATPGTLDLSFFSTGYLDISSLIGVGQAPFVYAYPKGNILQGKLLIGVDTGNGLILARVDEADFLLDLSFGENGIAKFPTLLGLTTVSVDGNNRILVAGSDQNSCWAERLTSSGSLDVALEIPSDIVAIICMHQQQSGRYIISGQDTSGKGIIVAYQDRLSYCNQQLVIDTSFNPLGCIPGRYVIASKNLCNFAIDSDDTIITAFFDTTMKVTKIKADGSGLVTSFGFSGFVDTQIDNVSPSNFRCSLDSNHKVIIGASTQDNKIKIMRYLSSGLIDTSFHGGSMVTCDLIGNSAVILTDLIITNEIFGDDKIIALGYNTSTDHENIFVLRLSPDGQYDVSFNPSGSGSDIPGMIKLSVASSFKTYCATLSIDGMLYIAATTGVDPIILKIFGDSYISQVDQQQIESVAGTLDYTLDTVTPGSGSLCLNTSLSLHVGKPEQLYMSRSEMMYIVSSLQDSILVTALQADMTLDQSFGVGGIATIAHAQNFQSIAVGCGHYDDKGLLYLTGNGDDFCWMTTLNSAGKIVSSTDLSVIQITQIVKVMITRTGRILVAGFQDTIPIIAAFQPDGATLDISFGNARGYYLLDASFTLYDLAIDQDDRIYIVGYDGVSNLCVQRLFASGISLDKNFNVQIPQNIETSIAKIFVAIDRCDNQLCLCTQSGSQFDYNFQIRRISTVDGAYQGSVSGMNFPSLCVDIQDFFIDSDENMYVIGSCNQDQTTIVARIKSIDATSIALDLDYAAQSSIPGVAKIQPGAMTSLVAGVLHKDRRVYLLGTDSLHNIYLARIFGDAYTHQIQENPLLAVPGSVDEPFDFDLVNQVESNVTSLLQGYKIHAVHGNNDGSLYLAFGDGQNLMIGKIDANMNFVVEFGAGGLTQKILFQNIHNLVIDSHQRILVVGQNNEEQIVVRYTATGELDVIFTTNLVVTTGTAIAEQKSGIVLVGGKVGSTGAINGYLNTGLQTATTFGPANLNGYYATGVDTDIDDLVVDQNDYIYCVYRDSDGYVCLEKILPTGSAKVVEFNNGQTVVTEIAAKDKAYIAINDVGNIIIGATTSTGIQVLVYDGITGQIIGLPTTISSDKSLLLTKIVGSGSDFIGSVSTTDLEMIAFRIIGSSGLLDVQFGLSHNGMATCKALSINVVQSMAIQPDGKIIMAGIQNDLPFLMRLYGYSYIKQYPCMPGRAPAGGLDTTLSLLTNNVMPSKRRPVGTIDRSAGIFNFQNLFSDIDLTGYCIKRICKYSNGLMVFAADDGVNTILFRLNKDFTLDTQQFNNPLGYLSIPGIADVTGLCVDEDGNIFIAGGVGTSWIRAYKNDGTVSSLWKNSDDTMNQGSYEIQQQSCSRLIVAGYDLEHGSLYGYGLTGLLDTQFGQQGRVDIGLDTPIVDIAIDSLDRILAICCIDGTSAVLKISALGDRIEHLGGGTPITNITNNQIKIALDAQGNIIVGAATTSGFMIRRYNFDGTDNGLPVEIVAGVDGTTHLGNIYVTSDNKIGLIGYETTGNTIILVRCTSLCQLDPAFNASGILATTITPMDQAYDAVINDDSRIMIVGGSSTAQIPCMVRVYGDSYVSVASQSPLHGIPGTLDPTFGDAGRVDYSHIDADNVVGLQAIAVQTESDGSFLVALDAAGIASKLIAITSKNILDTDFGSNGFAHDAPDGVGCMMIDGNGRPILVGTTTDGSGWVQRYKNDNSGQLDTTFAGTGVIFYERNSKATGVVEQTVARLIIAGQDEHGIGVLRGYTDVGCVDSLFGSDGIYSTGVASVIYAVAVDQFDRIIIAYKHGNNVDLARLTRTGQADRSFGIAGTIRSAATGVIDASEIRLAFDDVGNIVLVTHQNSGFIVVQLFDNLTAVSGNGAPVVSPCILQGFGDALLTSCIAMADGYIIISGNYPGLHRTWFVRLRVQNGTIILDESWNPLDTIPGNSTIVDFQSGSNSISLDGRLVALGNNGTHPVMIRLYNDPYIPVILQSPGSKPIGTCDTTLGMVGANTMPCFGLTGGPAESQKGKSIDQFDPYNFIVALDGQSTDDTENRIFLNMFSMDGLLNQDFGVGGKVQIPHLYQNEHVCDMELYTVTGVHKAIIAGYVSNSFLGSCNASIMQYDFSLPGLDTTFGGYDGDPEGVVICPGYQADQLYRQSTGRIIVKIQNQPGMQNFLVGYTAQGLLDTTFADHGCFLLPSTGSCAMMIDSYDMIIVAYQDDSNSVAVARIVADGSGLDATFNPTGLVPGIIDSSDRITNLLPDSKICLASDLDGQIVIVGVIAEGNGFALYRYRYDGIQLAGSSIEHSGIFMGDALGGSTTSVYALSKLLVDAQGKMVIVACDTHQIPQSILITRAVVLQERFVLDINCNNPLGYVAYTTTSNDLVTVTDGMIISDGRIFVVGFQN